MQRSYIVWLRDLIHGHRYSLRGRPRPDPIHNVGYGLPRTPLPRTPVNRPEATLKPLDASRALPPTQGRSLLPPPIRPAPPYSASVQGTPYIISDRVGVAVVLGVRLVDRWRHEVVFSTRYEQQRCPVFVPEVDVNILVTGREVGQGPGPYKAARRGDVVALVDLV